MANPSVRGRAGTGATRQRSVAAAARAAAKRAEKAQHADPSEVEAAGDIEPRAEQAEQAERPEQQEQSEQQGQQEQPEGAAKPSRRRSGLLSAILALLVVAGLAATAMLGWQYRDAERTHAARAEALAAAQKAAPVILSYDYRHLERDFAAARGHITGSFLKQYRKTTSTVVAPTATKYHGVVKASVAKPASGDAPAASVVSASPDRAVVLLFMNQVTNSTQVSGPRVDLNRVRLTLTRTSSGWKVSAVDAL